MKKHLFITGPSGCGKTTLLRQELGGALAYAGGFVTERVCGEDGRAAAYDLCPAAAAAGIGGFEAHRFLDLDQTPPRKDNEVFRGPAVKMLEEAAYYPFAVIDEFGGFELVIPQFRAALEELLNSELPIIGVLKGPDNASELKSSLGLGDRYTMLTDKLRAALSADPDTVVLEMLSRGDETVRRIVRQWVAEYANG